MKMKNMPECILWQAMQLREALSLFSSLDPILWIADYHREDRDHLLISKMEKICSLGRILYDYRALFFLRLPKRRV